MPTRDMGVSRIAAFLVVALLSAEAAAEPHFPTWPLRLQAETVKATKRYKGELHLYVKDLTTDAEYSYNGHTNSYLASFVKVPFMIELFRQLRVGKVSLDQEIEYTVEDVRDGSPVFNYVKAGTRVTLQTLLEAMIQHSDNAASDMVARTVGIENVNRSIKEMGYRFGPITTLLDVRRLVFGNLDPRIRQLSAKEIRSVGFAKGRSAKALKLSHVLGESPGTFGMQDVHRAYVTYYDEGWNSGSMIEAGRLVEALVEGKIVSPQASKKMVDIMLGTKTGMRRIRGKLGKGLKLAHKTGTQYGRLCDIGVMWPKPKRPVVFAACTKWGKQRGSEELLARLAKSAHDLIGNDTLGKISAGSSTTTAVLDAADELLEAEIQRLTEPERLLEEAARRLGRKPPPE